MLRQMRLNRWITGLATSGRTAMVTRYGPADVVKVCTTGLELQSRPRPDSVRIRVHAASINPLDIMMRQGYGKSIFECLRHEQFPFCLGLDCVGTVESVGSLVQNFTKGDRVMGVYSPVHHTGNGTWCESVDLPASLISRVPEHLDDHSAAAIPFAAMTAASSIGSRNIQRAVVLGASGGVGLFALQLLKHQGAHVVAVASGINSQICSDFGADSFVDYSKESIDEKVEPKSIDFVLDASGKNALKEPTSRELQCLQPGATYATLSSPFIRTCDSYNNFVVGASAATATLVQSKAQYQYHRQVNYEWAFFKPCTSTWNKIVELSSNGKLRSQISKVFQLDEIEAAQNFMETKHVAGKVIVSMA